MIAEIINPSDPYTLETDNFLAAAVGIALVGNGKLGLSCENPKLRTPILFGWDQWFKDQGIDDLGKWLEAHSAEVADALDSVMIGNIGDRALFLDALEAIDDPVKREAFRAKQHDKKRSSMNDIGAACWKTAAALRKKSGKVTKAEPIILVGR